MTDPQHMIESHFDGELTAEEHAELERWLAEDASHRQQLVDATYDALILRDALAATSPEKTKPSPTAPQQSSNAIWPHLPERPVDQSPPLPVNDQHIDTTDLPLVVLSESSSASSEREPVAPAQLHRNTWQRTADRVQESISLWMAVSLTLTFVGLGAFIFWITPRGQDDPAGPASESIIVAKVTGLVDVSWRKGAMPWEYGVSLKEGRRLEIESGLAELTFIDGAKVILEGPCDFTVDATGTGTLEFGSLAAVVPPRAIGFTIATPAAQIVDRGTEFGVKVRKSGAADVVVLVGEVDLVCLNGSREEEQSIRLGKGQGALVDRGRIVPHGNVDASVVSALRQRIDRAQKMRDLEKLSNQATTYAHWPFDDEAGKRVRESSPHARHGRLQGDDGEAVLGVDGVFGRAAEFSGGSALEVPRLPLSRSAFTIAAHLRPRSLVDNAQVFGDWSPPHQFRLYWNADGSVGFQLRRSVAGASSADLVRLQTPPGMIQCDRWTHVVAVWDRSAQTARLYVDARVAAEATVVDEPWNLDLADGGHHVYHAGKKQDDPTVPFDGSIDELWVISRPLNGTGIEDLMKQNKCFE